MAENEAAKDAVETTVNDVVEFRNEARDYMVANYYDEWVETYQSIKCRCKPFKKKNAKGEEVEDKSRTAVAMPDQNIIFRRNVARMTAQPYQLRYTGGTNPLIADLLSAQASQQYDQSNEQREDRRLVMLTEALGCSDMKLYWDTIAPTRVYRKALMKGNDVVYRDRKSIMAAQGANDDDIAHAVEEQGADMNDDEVAEFIGKSGKEFTLPEKVKKYEGPVCKAIFPGDIFIEPGALYLDESCRVVEQYVETDQWLKDKVKNLTYKDDKGNDVPAFDQATCEELITMDPGKMMEEQKISDLRFMFRGVMGKSSPWIAKRLQGIKRFDILEAHEQGEDGRMWITWISEFVKGKPLGRMPYPWELYGKYAYTRLCPLPDLIDSIGDSTPRLLRYLHQLLNFTAGQNFDYISALMKRLTLVGGNEDMDGQITDLGFMRALFVKDPRNFQPIEVPPLPNGALERSAELWRVIGMAEPSMNAADSGTSMNPQAGKTATTAVLAAKALDALTSWKIDGRNIYLRELGQKKLWMNQQAATEEWTIQSKFWTPELKAQLGAMNPEQLGALVIGYDPDQASPQEWVSSSRFGKTASIQLSPLDIQQDYECEPVAGSYLAVDDELRQSAAMQVQQVATANPGIIDQRKLATFQLSCIRGIGDPEDYILPPPPPPPPMPPKVGVNFSIAWKDLTPGVQNEVLQTLGLPPDPGLAVRAADAPHEATLDGVRNMSEAADAANNLVTPAGSPNTPDTPQGVDAQARSGQI